MKKIFFISVLLIICFISCDGRDRAQNSNKENLENSKLPDSFFVQTKYIPQEYSETITDTILSNGYRVTIKFFPDMNASILKEYKKDTIHYKEFYREFKSNVLVHINEKEIFNKIIDKAFFKEYYDSENTYFEGATLLGVWLDELSSTLENKIIIDVSFVSINESFSPKYRVSIDDEGKYLIELKNKIN